jgi:hypothetical protein
MIQKPNVTAGTLLNACVAAGFVLSVTGATLRSRVGKTVESAMSLSKVEEDFFGW